MIVSCRYGRMFVHEHQAYISESLIAYGEYSEGEVTLFRALLRPGDVVIEVGANIGAHTVALAKIVGDTGAVYAFEPQRIVHQALCANVAINDLRNVNTFQAAVGDRGGVTTIESVNYDAPHNSGGARVGRTGEAVGMVRLDDLPIQDLAFLKADVEGSETEVLRGAADTISRCQPIIYVEDDKEDRRAELRATLRGLGYRMWNHRPLLFNPDNYNANATNQLVDEHGTPYASFNLLCLPKESPIPIEGLEEVA